MPINAFYLINLHASVNLYQKTSTRSVNKLTRLVSDHSKLFIYNLILNRLYQITFKINPSHNASYQYGFSRFITVLKWPSVDQLRL